MKRHRTKEVTILYDDTKKTVRVYRESYEKAREQARDFLNTEKAKPKGIFLISPRHPEVVDFIAGPDIDKFLMRKKSFDEIIKAIPRKPEAGGLLVYCKKTRRFLFQIRGLSETNPWVAGLWGGRVAQGETPAITAARSALEEGGFRVDDATLLPLWTDENQNLIWHNFLCVVNEEFDPQIDESKIQDYIWVGYDGLRRIDLHPGARKLFQHDPVLNRLREELQKRKSPELNFRAIVEDILR